jgi:tetratricopeptide (TPR) repeat protein
MQRLCAREDTVRPHTPAPRPGRNDPCRCGSGRKFKVCCGAAPAQQDAGHFGDDPGSRPNIGRLTEASKVREVAERFQQLRFGPPAALFAEPTSSGTVPGTRPAHQIIAAERQRQRGEWLLKSRKYAAAIAALRQAAELDPGDAVCHQALGRALLQSGRFEEAIASLQLATTLNHTLGAAHCDLAAALDASGRAGEAVAAGRRAVALAPGLAEAHRQLGELLEAAGDTSEAAECFRRAAACAADTTAGRLDAARALLLEGDLREAEGRLREAAAVDPRNDELHKVLAEVLAKQGRFAEAIEACDRALNINPLQVPAHLTAVRVRKCVAADRPRLVRMLATLRHPAATDAHRLFLHFAIGKLLDDLGEYRDAMRHFDLANRIRSRTARFDRAALAKAIDRLIARYTPAFFADHAAFGVEDETPLLIVGMPRSGTTLIEQIITAHPEIAAGEELFFWFNRAGARAIAEASALTPQAGRALAAEYIALLRRIGPSAARVTDKQTFNFQQLGLVHLLLPRARVIHCRRHPLDTCLSMYFTYFKGRIPFISDKADLAFAYRQYARIIEHWRKVLPSDRFLEIDYEELVADRERVTRRLVAFTGLDWHDACLAPERNKRAVSTASLWQARQPVFTTSVERWRRYEPWIGELRDLIPAADAGAAQ